MRIKGKQRLTGGKLSRKAILVFMALFCAVILISFTAVPAKAFDWSKDPFERGEEMKEALGGESSGGNSSGGDPSGSNPSGGNPSGGNPSGGNSSGGNSSGGNSSGGKSSGDGTAAKEKLKKANAWLAGWAGKIGLFVAFYGAIEMALSFMNDDADAKLKGLKIMVTGFMVWSICQNLDKFYE